LKTLAYNYFYARTHEKKVIFPFDVQMELTYRCNLNCVHCYCKGQEDKGKELSADELKRILDELWQQGCLWLAFSGGECLSREDFLEIYAYAKQKGFIITIFTNGQLLDRKTIECLVKTPPHSIEITLNGITKDTYELITRVKESFPRVMENIKILVENKLPLIIKTNLLKQNQNEIIKIKSWVENFLGKPKGKNLFKYDYFIYPRMNGDTAPLKFRLSFEEIIEIIKKDPDMYLEYRKDLRRHIDSVQRSGDYLYQCNCWMSQAFISPYGNLKFCLFSEKFSLDLRENEFKDGFYRNFPKLLEERFKTDSPCSKCRLRPVCRWCPALAYLETGNEENPLLYCCGLAQNTHKAATQMAIV